MGDINTGLQILGAAIGSAKLVEKVLGPTAGYLGDSIKNWTQKRVQSLARIIKKSAHKLDKDLEYSGQVNPRVLKEVITEGTFFDDELAEEYFAGVLASSRRGFPEDDRGAILLKRVSTLSVFQIRAHYIFYSLFKSFFNKSSLKVTNQNEKRALLFIRYGDFIDAMKLRIQNDIVTLNEGGESTKFADDILIHCVFGLLAENLLTIFVTGSQSLLNKDFKKIPSHGIVVSPSPLGVELFLWANGKGNINVNDFFRNDVTIDNVDGIDLCDAIIVEEIRNK